ncbi:MAG: hypothetical protein ABI593_11320 [Betaproteobacteria bacterium]
MPKLAVTRLRRTDIRRAAQAMGLFLAVLAAGAQAQAGWVVPPLPVGPYAVACSNVDQDFSRVRAGETAQEYWEGLPKDGRSRYLTDLLIDPDHAHIVTRALPSDSTLFGPFAGSTFTYAYLICYPTDASNTRADFVLPDGPVVPRMQRGAEAPIFPAASGRFPVMLYGHGLSGSPLSDGYMDSIRDMASHGYVVIAAFHGDLRFADLDLDSFEDAIYALLHFKTFIAMQSARPISMSWALDIVLDHPDFRDHIDANKVVGFGASMGGEAMMLMAGAALTTSLGQSSTQVTKDLRLKAAVGYVPYFGIDVYPAFGRDLKGLDNVTMPFLAISGTADKTAPITTVERGIARLKSTRQLVALNGVRHEYDLPSTNDIITWTHTFLAGQLSGDPILRAASARMASVAGGGDDSERIDYMAPSTVQVNASGTPVEAIVVEYYNAALNHYFITAEIAEQAMLDAGIVVPGWARTGYQFKLRPADATIGLAACRFFGTPPLGPNSHFFTIDGAECAKVKANPLWTYEGLAFLADPPTAGDCAADRIPVIRLYNNGMGGQANHRFTTSRSESRAMQANGWILEGNVMCAIP